MTQQRNLLTYFKLLLMALFWGGTFIAGRLLGSEVEPFAAAFLRFAIASAALLIITLRTYKKLPPIQRNQWLPLLILGLSGVFAYNVFFFRGLQLITAGRAAIIIASNPIIIAIFAALFFGEKLSFLKITGVILSVCGAMLVITQGDPASLLSHGIGAGDLYILGCVACWVTYSLVGRSAMRSLSPLVSVTYSALIGTVLLCPVACMEGVLTHLPHYSLTAWLSLVYLGLFGTVLGFIWYYQGIKKIGATRAGQFINFVPISAILLSTCFLDEHLTASLLLGAFLVSGGAFLTNYQTNK